MERGKGLKKDISEKIRVFKKINLGSTDEIIVWEAFKAFIRGELISQACYRRKLKESARNTIIQHIGELEWQHKQRASPELWAALEAQLDQLKLIDAQVVARDIMYTKQK